MNVLRLILTILLVLGVLYTYVGYKEGFSLKPAEFPCSVENPNLFGDYPVRQNPQVSRNSYQINSQMDSYTDMSSYAQKTNNIRDWVTPDNGSCSPAEFCGSLYNKKIFNLTHPSPPNDANGVRVNYYTQS